MNRRHRLCSTKNSMTDAVTKSKSSVISNDTSSQGVDEGRRRKTAPAERIYLTLNHSSLFSRQQGFRRLPSRRCLLLSRLRRPRIRFPFSPFLISDLRVNVSTENDAVSETVLEERVREGSTIWGIILEYRHLLRLHTIWQRKISCWSAHHSADDIAIFRQCRITKIRRQVRLALLESKSARASGLFGVFCFRLNPLSFDVSANILGAPLQNQAEHYTKRYATMLRVYLAVPLRPTSASAASDSAGVSFELDGHGGDIHVERRDTSLMESRSRRNA